MTMASERESELRQNLSQISRHVADKAVHGQLGDAVATIAFMAFPPQTAVRSRHFNRLPL